MVELFRSGIRQIRSIAENDLAQRLGMALLEVLCVGIVGLVPLFAAPFLKASDPNLVMAGASGEFRALISLGQLYLYSFSLVGTLFWLLFARTTAAHVSLRVGVGVVVALVAIISMSIYIQNPAMTEKIPEHLITLSEIIFVACLAIYFILLMCSSAKVPTAGSTLTKGIDRLVEKAEGRST